MLPILAALSVGTELVKLVPGLYKLFGNDPPPPIVERVVDIANTITGTTTPEEALQKLKADSELMAKYQDAAEARALELTKSYLADVQDARNRDIEITKVKGSNKRADALVLVCVLGIAACIMIACFAVSLNEFGKTVVNVALGTFLGTWAQVANFEFGSTKANKDKDNTINKLAGDGSA